MSNFVAKRIRFQNGEHYSVLARPHGLPVHEATLYLNRYRRSGRAANTIHSVCCTLVLLYRELVRAEVDLPQRLRAGQFLTMDHIGRLAAAAQYRLADLSIEDSPKRSQVVDIKHVRARRKAVSAEIQAVDAETQASRLRYMADYLEFLTIYFGASLPNSNAKRLRTTVLGLSLRFEVTSPASPEATSSVPGSACLKKSKTVCLH